MIHVFLALASGCGAFEELAIEASDVAGAKADAHCDRRFVDGDGRPAAFCQEIVATVAAAEFANDCRARHRASAGAGRCARANVIAGCKLHVANRDASQVWDWYYDVSELAPDTSPSADGAAGASFQIRPRTVDDVAALCVNRARYGAGAELATP